MASLSKHRQRPENREKTGRFKPGKSGNPGGRPRDAHGIAELARQHAPQALQRLLELMASADENVSLKACVAVIDRGYGKPAQALEHTGEGGGAIEHKFKSDRDFGRHVAFALTKGMRAPQQEEST